MNKQLRLALEKEFRNVFETLTPCGGNGWFLIVWELAETLEALGVRAIGMKEKYGSLCFRVSETSKENRGKVERAIRKAARRSDETCENCGAPGTLNDDGWQKTLCERCPVVTYG